MKVLVLAHEYPHALNSTMGSFVHEQVKALLKHCEVVVSPTPLTSPIMRRIKPYWAYYAAKPRKTDVDGADLEQFAPQYKGLSRMELGLPQDKRIIP